MPNAVVSFKTDVTKNPQTFRMLFPIPEHKIHIFEETLACKVQPPRVTGYLRGLSNRVLCLFCCYSNSLAKSVSQRLFKKKCIH